MKLLLTMNLPYTRSHGGANRSNRGLCEGLVQAGHTVRVVVPTLSTPSPVTREQVLSDLADQGVRVSSKDGVDLFTLGGVEIRAVADPSRLRAYLVQQLKEFGPDWALVSSEDPSQTLLGAALKECSGRVIYLAHTPPLFPFGPESLYPGEARTDLVRQAAAVVPISKYAAAYIEKWSGIKATPIHFPHFGSGPFPHLGRFANPYVLLMNACVVKGLPIFLALARALPDVSFAALPGYGTTDADRAALAAQPNVTLLQNRRDLDDILCQTRILLMPSLWVESFGMAVVDAMLRGIPVLSSNFGGLLEAKLGTDYLLPVNPIERFEEQLGDNMLPTPIVPEQDITPWLNALRELLSDKGLYARQSEAAREAALAFASGLSVGPFIELLNRLERESQAGSKHTVNAVGDPGKQPATASDGFGNLDNLSPQQQALLVRMLKKKSAERPEGEAAGRLTATIPRCSREGVLPLSFAQQRLWFLDQLTPGTGMYNMAASLRLAGPLDAEALERALNEVARRHEVLRTNFTAVDGEPAQVIRETLPVSVLPIDLSGLAEADRETEIRLQSYEEGRLPFDLEKDSLVRIRILRLDEQDHLLLMTMHHIIADGSSMGILVSEVKALYTAFSLGESPMLPELPIQYADFTVWQHRWLQGNVLQAERDYWINALAGAPNQTDLPIDRHAGLDGIAHGAVKTILVPQASVDALKALCRRCEATLFAGLLACLDALLFRWAAQKDVVIGVVSANRNRAEIEPLIGCFMNFLPLRATLTGGMTGEDLLRQARATVTDAFSHQDFPFEKIVEAVNPERSGMSNPIYNVGLLLQNFDGPQRFTGTVRDDHVSIDNQAALLDLRFIAVETDAGLLLTCDYHAGLFDPRTIDLLVDSFEQVLTHLGAHSEEKVSALPIADGLAAQATAARERARARTVAVAATFTAEPIEESLSYWMQTLDMPAQIEFAPYNQVFQQLLDPASQMAVNGYGANILLIRLEDWTDTERNTGDFIAALKPAAARSRVPYLVCICPPSPAAITEKGELLAALAGRIAAELADVSGIVTITTAELRHLYPVADYDDPDADELGHIPYRPAFYAALGTAAARKIHALSRAPFKVIALDCDNTLWGGVVGEDGPMGIKIDAPRKAMQEFLIRQQQAGMLLCLCSKNEERDVLEVFERRGDMPLKRDHLVGWRINWEPKSNNLRALAEELELGLDSFIFIDDNPVECAQVLAECPEVLTLELPQAVERIPRFLEHVWAFDHVKTTSEDSARTAMYRQNLERKRLLKSQPTLGDFLSGLEMHVEIMSMTPDQLARVSQLTVRTNQFNVSTRRRSELEVSEFCGNPNNECLTVSVRDRFGDYGLVGVFLFSRETDKLCVDTFLLSCRSLGRGVEHGMLARLGRIALEHGLSRVEIPFIPTEKNQPALNFLSSAGAESDETRGQTRVFRFAAGRAAETHYGPAPSVPSVTGNAAEPPRIKRHGGSSLFPRIAHDLSGVDDILEQIRLREPMRTASSAEYAAPRTPAEETLAGIWRAVLRLEKVGIHDNFFDLGGHSLMAVQAISRIRVSLGVDITLRAIFEAPTISGLADLIAHEYSSGNQGVSTIAPQIRVSGLDQLSVDEMSEAELDAVLRQLAGEEALHGAA